MPLKAVETTTGGIDYAGCREQDQRWRVAEHVKNKDAVFHSQMLLPNRAPVVNKAAQSRRMRSSDAGFVEARDQERCARVIEK